MKESLKVFLLIVVLLITLCGCAEYQYGGNYFFPPYPYEYADPYNNYYYYNSYYYSPYYYRFPPPPLPPEEGGKEFRYGEREGKGREEVK